MPIFPMQPPFVVEVGPYAGVYFSEEVYRRRAGLLSPLEDRFESPTKSIFDENPWLDEGGGG